MRIAFFVHQFLPRYVTGTEQYVRSLSIGLRGRGHDVRVFSFEPQMHIDDPQGTWFERDEEVEGIPVRRVALNEDVLSNRELTDYHNPLAERLCRRFLEQHPADLVHVFHLRNIGVGGIQEPRSMGIPVVVNLMDFWFLCPRFTLFDRSGNICDGPPRSGLGCIDCLDPDLAEEFRDADVEELLLRISGGTRFPSDYRNTSAHRGHALIGRKDRLFDALAQADEILSPSEFLASVFEKQGFPPGRIHKMAYGVDPGRLEGFRRARKTARKTLRIGYIGSVTPHKGLHVLVQAVRSYSEGDVEVQIYGDPAVHPEYSRRIDDLIDGDARIRIEGGFEPDQLGRVLSAVDIVVVPSLWYENTPFTVLEALMARVPVVASDLGGISEVIQDGVNGLLFEAGNVAELKKRLEALAGDSRKVSALRKGTQPRTLEDNLDGLEEVYRKHVPTAGAKKSGKKRSGLAAE